MTHFFLKRPDGRYMAVQAKTWEDAQAQARLAPAQATQNLHRNDAAAPSAPGLAKVERRAIEDDCTRPLTGQANNGQTVNSRRKQVRQELEQAMRDASRAGGDPGAAYLGQVGANVARLAPNWGRWIRGGTNKPDGNLLYGAVTDALGIPLPVALGFANAAEYGDDILDRIGLGGPPDQRFGGDSPEARAEIIRGARCGR